MIRKLDTYEYDLLVATNKKSQEETFRKDEDKQTWGWFKGHYIKWRETRINKLVSILGKDWFKGKTVLECACGLGHVGEELMNKYGAIVTFAEGRDIFVYETKKRLPSAEVIVLDNDSDWNLNRKFDLLIHWGLLYHTDNWKRDLENAVKHADIISLETVVYDIEGRKEIKIREGGHHHGATHGIGTRASVEAIESHLESLGTIFQRYDDKDLNAEYFQYDWKSTGNGRHGDNTRRFWMIDTNK